MPSSSSSIGRFIEVKARGEQRRVEEQPNSEVMNTQGESANLELTTTFLILSPRASFITLVSGSNSALSSSNFLFSSSSSTPFLRKESDLSRSAVVREDEYVVLGGAFELLATGYASENVQCK